MRWKIVGVWGRKWWNGWVENGGKVGWKMVERLGGKWKKFNTKDG